MRASGTDRLRPSGVRRTVSLSGIPGERRQQQDDPTCGSQTAIPSVANRSTRTSPRQAKPPLPEGGCLSFPSATASSEGAAGSPVAVPGQHRKALNQAVKSWPVSGPTRIGEEPRFRGVSSLVIHCNRPPAILARGMRLNRLSGCVVQGQVATPDWKTIFQPTDLKESSDHADATPCALAKDCNAHKEPSLSSRLVTRSCNSVLCPGESHAKPIDTRPVSLSLRRCPRRTARARCAPKPRRRRCRARIQHLANGEGVPAHP
jgi:hypothetical protein